MGSLSKEGPRFEGTNGAMVPITKESLQMEKDYIASESDVRRGNAAHSRGRRTPHEDGSLHPQRLINEN